MLEERMVIDNCNDVKNSERVRLMKDVKNDLKPINFKSGSNDLLRFVLPGEVITEHSGYMRGHGTYTHHSQLHASIAGVVEQIDKLVKVRPMRTRYEGEIGDVVVGRIIDVQQKRWKVETNSRLDSVLLLSGVNLPGGELRRKTVEDEIMMRQLFAEGDLISAEVQSIFEDGAVSLHTRSLKYGKLGQGVLVIVSPSLIERRKTHFHKLPCGAQIIIGNNGFIWISPVTSDSSQSGGFVLDTTLVQAQDREVIARIRNCILALAQHKIKLHDTSIMYAYDMSIQLGYQVKQLLLPQVINIIALATREKLEMAME